MHLATSAKLYTDSFAKIPPKLPKVVKKNKKQPKKLSREINIQEERLIRSPA